METGDTKTELQLYSALFGTFQDKAVISSLHRLHLLSQFDYVYILKNGKVIDEGTFDHLSRYSFVLQEMMRHQTSEEPSAVIEVAL